LGNPDIFGKNVGQQAFLLMVPALLPQEFLTLQALLTSPLFARQAFTPSQESAPAMFPWYALQASSPLQLTPVAMVPKFELQAYLPVWHTSEPMTLEFEEQAFYWLLLPFFDENS
jgi:hypothetical protein